MSANEMNTEPTNTNAVVNANAATATDANPATVDAANTTGATQEAVADIAHDATTDAAQETTTGTAQGATSGTAQGATSGAAQGATSGTAQDVASDATQQGMPNYSWNPAGNQQGQTNAFSGNAQNNVNGMGQQNFAGNGQNGFNGNGQNSFSGNGQNGFNGNGQNGFSSNGQNGFNGNGQNSFSGNGQNGFNGNTDFRGPVPPAHKPPKPSFWKGAGFHALYGLIAGGVAVAVFLVTTAIALPKIATNSIESAYAQVESSVEDHMPDIHMPHSSESGDDSSNSGNSGGKQSMRSSDGESSNNGSSDSDANQNGNSSDAGNESESNGNGDFEVKGGTDSNTESAEDAANTPFLGIGGTGVSEVDEETLGDTDYPDGVYVTYVAPTSAASIGGVKLGDVVTAVNGESISSFEELKSIVESCEVGDTLTLTISRLTGSEFNESTHSVTLGSRADIQQYTTE